MTEDGGMMDRFLEEKDGRTADRRSAADAHAVGVAQRQCRWTVVQKRRIVAEILEQGVSAAVVAHRHGITRGQFYAWRQWLLLAGALDAAAATLTSLLSIDAPTTGPGGPLAWATSPACAVLGTRVACLPARREDLAGAVHSEEFAPTAVAASCAVSAPSSDRCSVASSAGGRAADRGQVEQFGQPAPPVACDGTLRGLRHADGIGGAPVPGQQLRNLVLPGATGDETLQHVDEPGEWFDTVQLRRVDQRHGDRPVLGAAIDAGEQAILAST